MIYDYFECQKIFDSFNNTKIIEHNPLGYTSLEHLPIRYFTYGNGNNNIVVIGSQHSSEIISTTFVINLIHYLLNNNIEFNDITIHFIPILNPEGYLINTMAIRSKLSKYSSSQDIREYCYQFYKNYRYDIYHNDDIKLHQVMFEDIDSRIIPENYPILKDSVSDILSNHPKGSIIDWASNGKGIDLNSNSINKIVNSNETNKSNAYNNIRLDIPSPIGYPGENTNINFKQENEIEALNSLLSNLSNIKSIFNYHSTGGIIYQRPENNDLYHLTYNYLLSKFYQELTIKNDSNYNIIVEKANKITSVNDVIRINYLGDLLIELSPMMGNPIGMFGDNTNIEKTINSNIQSFIYTINNIDKIINVTNHISSLITLDDNLYCCIDSLYKKIRKK